MSATSAVWGKRGFGVWRLREQGEEAGGGGRVPGEVIAIIIEGIARKLKPFNFFFAF